jgi:alcohol dehydrogenase
MRAQQYDAVGAPIRLVEVPAPLCPVDGVVVDVRATGICRSDWHAWRGHERVPLPQIPGHEFAGVVSASGGDVASVAVGDRVTAPFVNGCGRCSWCRTGQAQVCPDQSQPGFSRPGSHAEQVVVPFADFNVVRLPDTVDFVSAAALGCRFATAFHALTAQARLAAGEWVAVYGCGGVGLSTIMIATALGARVVAVDPSPGALDRAAELGAEVTVAASQPVAVVVKATEGGAHVTVDALGSADTAARSIRSLRRRGRHVQVGLMADDDRSAPLPWDLVVGCELQVVGSHGMAAAEYPAMLAMIIDGRLRPQRLVGSVISLDEAGQAMMAMDQLTASRPGIVVATV